jgi:cytoskeleton protein RodZ
MTLQQELIPMAPGEFLQRQRILRKLNLETVARAINLDESLLRKIEQGDAGHIAPVYRNGYIQSYANYLQIPQDEIQKLIDQTSDEETGLRTVFSEPPKRNPVDNWLRASSYVLASLLIGTLAWQFTHEAVRLSQNGSRLSGGQAELQSTDATVRPGQALTGPVNASIAALDVLHDGQAQGTDTAAQAWAASRTPLPEGESRLQVSASADSWIEISDADGKELEMDLLRGGSKKSYQGKMPFRILIGRASAVRLSMNGEPVDMAPFIRDDVAQMRWPQQLQAEAGKQDDADNTRGLQNGPSRAL